MRTNDQYTLKIKFNNDNLYKPSVENFSTFGNAFEAYNLAIDNYTNQIAEMIIIDNIQGIIVKKFKLK